MLSSQCCASKLNLDLTTGSHPWTCRSSSIRRASLAIHRCGIAPTQHDIEAIPECPLGLGHL